MIVLTDLPKDAAGYADWPLEQLEVLARPILLLEYLGNHPMAEGMHYLTDKAFAEIQDISKQLYSVSSAVINAIAVRDDANVIWNNPSFAPEYQSYRDAGDYVGLVSELTKATSFTEYAFADESIDNILNRLQREVRHEVQRLFSQQVGELIQGFGLAGIPMNPGAFQTETPPEIAPDAKLISAGRDESNEHGQSNPIK